MISHIVRWAAGTHIVALALLLLGTPAPAVAQQGTVTGRLVDQATLEPISGAQVYIPGTGLGTLTNPDGRYLLQQTPAGEVEVRVEILGYRTITRSVVVQPGETTVVDFELTTTALALEELVVTATGLQRARELGNAVASINATEVVERAQPTSVETLLQSRAPGVAIRGNTGSLGTAGDIKIRGPGSISLTNRPVVYIDGARIAADAFDAGTSGQDYSRLNDLNPADIASIEVVKGPAAATLYGTQAAGGVVRITTKQGRQGPARYSFRVEYGANWDDNEYQPTLWNPRSMLTPLAEQLGTVAKDTIYAMRLLETDNPFRTGWEKTLAGSVRGGLEGVNYYVAGQWSDRNGQTVLNKVDRYNFRANFSMTPSEKVDVTVSNGLTNSFVSLPNADNSGSGLIAQAYLGFPWIMPIMHTDPNDPDGEAIRTCPLNVETARITGEPLNELGFDGCSEKPGFGGRNQSDLRTLTNSNHTLRYTGSSAVTYTPIETWTNRFVAGYDFLTDQWTELVPVDPSQPFGSDSEGDLDNHQVRRQNLSLEGTSSLSYDLPADLNTVTTVGVQYFREFQEQVDVTGRVFPAGSPAVNNSVLNEGDDEHLETRTLGFFIQEQFGWNDRLFLTPAVRFDDNSAFGRDLGLKTYPKVSASWVASDEAFTPDFLEMLKLRAAWGMSGMQPGPNDALGRLTPTPVIMRGEEVLGVRPNRPGNPGLKPETGKELEVGFDMRTWQGRLGVQFTYYRTTTEDALVERPLAPSSGFPEDRWENIGEVKKSGVELGLDLTAVNRPEFAWDWRLVLNTLSTEITELPDPILFGSQRHQEGYPWGAFFEKPVFINDAGDVEARDEFEFLGQPLPEFEGALSQTLSFLNGRIVVYGNLAFAGGHQVLNFSDVFRCRSIGGGPYGGVCTGIHEREPGGSFTDEARIKQRASLNNFSNAPWVEDADWLKLRTLSVQFQLPEKWISLMGFRSASLRLLTENVATWTRYSGMDPESHWAGGDSEASRSEFYTVPPARRFISSLSFTF